MDEREEVSQSATKVLKLKVAKLRKIDFFDFERRNSFPAFVFMRLTTATDVKIGGNALF